MKSCKKMKVNYKNSLVLKKDLEKMKSKLKKEISNMNKASRMKFDDVRASTKGWMCDLSH